MTDFIITGMPGTGKSTIGRIVATRLGMGFVDMDLEIERREGRTVEELFREKGEMAFRSIERALLLELQSGDGRVIATGGGTLVDAKARVLLGPHQHVLCLTCSVEEISARISGQGHRPLLRDGDSQAIQRLLDTRSSAYSLFEQIDASGSDTERVVRAVLRTVAARSAESLMSTRDHRTDILVLQNGVDTLGEELRTRFGSVNVVLVSDETVDELGIVGRIAARLYECGLRVHPLILPTGESQKCMDTLTSLYHDCARHNIDRRSVVIGVGGGVVCDIAGMIAATYLRGISLALVPTTLLAQVDASVGGKVGVDLGGTKNLVGAFWPAGLVLVDPVLLQSLRVETVRDGLAEVIKIAFMCSADLVAALESLDRPEDISRETGLIRQAIQQKVRLVASDPYERGERAFLNFGHTVGHGLEAASKYGLSHGQAVSVGMIAEASLATEMGRSDPACVERLARLLGRVGLPLSAERSPADEVMFHVQRDKKRYGDEFRIAVPVAPGDGTIFGVSAEQLHQSVLAVMETAV